MALRTVSNDIQLPTYVPIYINVYLLPSGDSKHKNVLSFFKSTNGGVNLHTILPKKIN